MSSNLYVPCLHFTFSILCGNFNLLHSSHCSDIPPHVDSVTFELTQGIKLTLPLDSLDQDKEMLHRYKLTGEDPLMDYGSLQLSIRYMNDLRMTKDDYDSLQNLLLKLEDPACFQLSSCYMNDLRMPKVDYDSVQNLLLKLEGLSLKQTVNFSDSHKKLFAASLFRVFQYNGRDIELIVNLCTVCKPFDDDMGLRIIMSFVRNKCAEYLKATLSKTMQSTFLDSDFKDLSTTTQVWYLVKELSESIFNSLAICPKSVRYICSCLVDKQTALPDAKTRAAVVSEFMFQRLFCPALENAIEFGLLDKESFYENYFNLTMAVKCLDDFASMKDLNWEKVNH